MMMERSPTINFGKKIRKNDDGEVSHNQFWKKIRKNDDGEVSHSQLWKKIRKNDDGEVSHNQFRQRKTPKRRWRGFPQSIPAKKSGKMMIERTLTIIFGAILTIDL